MTGEARLREAFLREQRRGLRLLAGARLVALVTIVLFLLGIDRNFIDAATYLIVFALAGVALATATIVTRPWYRVWMLYALVALDHLLLGWALFGGAVRGDPGIPPAMYLRTEWFSIFFLFVAGSALTLAPRVVVWSGTWAATMWATGAIWVLLQPGSTALKIEAPQNPTPTDFIASYLAPEAVNLVAVGSQVLLLVLTAFTLSVAVKRFRRLVEQQVGIARERANLARYFSPDMVERLATKESPLAQPQTRPVAVLFADIMGFTRLCEGAAPETVIELLRGFRLRMERAVFAHGGTVDKHMGDCVMATFGMLGADPAAPASALACARAMLAGVERWNAERAQAGQVPIRLGIGLHWGGAVMGDIGGDRRIEFTVVGDTINVANRLEQLTRELDADLVASDALIQAAAREAGDGVFAGLARSEPLPLRGRDGAVAVWYLPRQQAAAA